MLIPRPIASKNSVGEQEEQFNGFVGIKDVFIYLDCYTEYPQTRVLISNKNSFIKLWRLGSGMSRFWLILLD